MDDCTNCEFLTKCRNGEKVKCPWEYLEEIYNPILPPPKKGKNGMLLNILLKEDNIMENLRTLYYLIKQWEKETQNLSNSQVIAIMQKMIAKAKKDYKCRGGKRAV